MTKTALQTAVKMAVVAVLAVTTLLVLTERPARADAAETTRTRERAEATL